MSEDGDHASSVADQLQRAFANAVDPVRAQLAEIEQTITAKEQELTELRKLRTQANKVLYTIDPESKPAKRASPGTRHPHNRGVKVERLDAIEHWLRENMDGEPFSIAGINNNRQRTGFDIVPHGTLAFAINALRDRGSIRFDRVGERGTKLYRLT